MKRGDLIRFESDLKLFPEDCYKKNSCSGCSHYILGCTSVKHSSARVGVFLDARVFRDETGRVWHDILSLIDVGIHRIRGFDVVQDSDC